MGLCALYLAFLDLLRLSQAAAFLSDGMGLHHLHLDQVLLAPPPDDHKPLDLGLGHQNYLSVWTGQLAVASFVSWLHSAWFTGEILTFA